MLVGGVLFMFVVVLFVLAIVAFVVAAITQSGLGGALVVLAVPFMLIAAAALVIRSFVRTWWPVRCLIRAAARLADGDYTVRVRPRGSASIRPVLSSFNSMAEQLETADEQRRRLLADLGHELRTPLTVVRGEVEAMIDGVHEPDREHLEILMAEVHVMERLLEDLRTLSLIDAGSLALHPEPTDIDELIGDVVEAHRRSAVQSGVALEVDSEQIDLVVDPVRMREVLGNLVVNSLRAMPEGGTLRVTARNAGAGAVIDVADTGTGIDPADLDHVFERFHKGATSPGSGLGLTISRDLVGAHGGSMAIESTVDVGTKVTVDLSGGPGTDT